MKLNQNLVEQLAQRHNLVVTAELEEYTIGLLAQAQRIVALNVVRQNCKNIVLTELQQHFFETK